MHTPHANKPYPRLTFNRTATSYAIVYTTERYQKEKEEVKKKRASDPASHP